MKYIKNKWTIIGVLVAAIGLLTAFSFESKKAPQYYTEKVQRGDIQNVVQATGTINAVTTVQVGSQVSGTIQTLFADFNSHVKKNQVIAQIDPSLFQGALLQAKADLADAQANRVAAKANLEKAQAAAAQAKLDFNRYTTLAQEGVVPMQQLDTARATSQSADAAVSAAKAQVTQASAQVQQKSAAVTVAQANLEHSTIRSPIDGTVIARSVDVGQTVAASLQAPTLFTIAQDLTKMQVYVSTDESDVGSIHAGQEVNFKVDAFPKDSFKGKVSAVRLNATTVQNVVTYTTVVDFDNPEMKLFPGMTAYVTVPVAQAADVVKVPNGALRFTPDLTAQQISDLYQKTGISASGGARGRKGGLSTQASG
ncbi:MAG TPA: efflux RND transporter periplasmic adaptor subunit, partial [Candidatus Sulfotelmatobacter sp.]|nr:efflux RND transporter periplasmic adaptor subunit [Candidatus Sulfotelmatobacter sp.]